MKFRRLISHLFGFVIPLSIVKLIPPSILDKEQTSKQEPEQFLARQSLMPYGEVSSHSRHRIPPSLSPTGMGKKAAPECMLLNKSYYQTSARLME